MAQTISLRHFLVFDQKLSLNLKFKTQLAFLLALSLLHLHDGPWLPHAITKDDIRFLIYNSRLSFVPYISKRFMASPHSTIQNAKTQSRYGQIFAFGLLLIELYAFTPIEQLLLPEDMPPGTPEIYDQVSFCAIRIHEQWKKRKDWSLIAKAVAACFDEAPRLPGMNDADFICTNIIQPLEEEPCKDSEFTPVRLHHAAMEVTVNAGLQAVAEQSARHNDSCAILKEVHPVPTPQTRAEISPGDCASPNEPARETRRTPPEPPASPDPTSPETAKRQRRTRSRRKNRITLENSVTVPHSESEFYSSRLYDHKFCSRFPTSAGGSRPPPSKEWFDHFQTVYEFLDNEKVLPWHKTSKPIKIAVLDTGVHMEDPFIAFHKRRIKVESFLECGGTESRKDGHGTLIVGLVLAIARNAKILVAKVAEDDQSPDAEAISKAIKHAATDWDADIISMSFGFDRLLGDHRDVIQESIKLAHSKDIIMFASGHNAGENKRMPYPANQEDKVIYIGATDSKGNPSTFSPKNGCHFFTFGEDVTSSGVTKSGASFATPIAAAIAALSLDYIYRLADPGFRNLPAMFGTKKSTDGPNNEIMDAIKKARALNGMKEILRCLCAPQSAYLAPWHRMDIQRIGVPESFLDALLRV